MAAHLVNILGHVTECMLGADFPLHLPVPRPHREAATAVLAISSGMLTNMSREYTPVL